MFAHFDRDRAYQNWTALVVDVFYLIEDGAVLLALGLIDGIVAIFAGHGPVRGNDQNAELVNIEEFTGFGFSGAGHAGQLVVKAEIILDRNGGQCLRLAFDGDAFLGFNGLVETFTPAAAGHQAAGIFIDD